MNLLQAQNPPILPENISPSSPSSPVVAELLPILPESNDANDPKTGTPKADTKPMGDLKPMEIKDLPKQQAKVSEAVKEKKWYEKYNFRGYTQFRYSTTMTRDTGPYDVQILGDRSVGNYQDFTIRRARFILFGDVNDHLALYVQPDLSITPPGSTDQTFYAQLRDLYGDVYLTKDKVHRIRVGLSKVPYGFENMQSSQNRLTFDRTEAINSAVSRNERDLGLFYYYTPEEKQHLFKKLVDDGLKGSGNYGLFGIGVYDGQGGSFLEQNNNLHAVIRGTYPFELDNDQIFEASVQALTGKSVVFSSTIRPLGVGSSFRPTGTLETGDRTGIIDQRVGVSAIWYPKPFGFQAEWNIGRGPGLADNQRSVISRRLDGGYAMLMYRYETPCWGTFLPFTQWTYYKGGLRSERNAPYLDINEWHAGVEWQIQKHMELTVQYTNTDRTNTTAVDRAGFRSYGNFFGSMLRFQFQLNY